MLCWLFRFMISHTVDKDSRPSGITQKHIRHCAVCRQFYKSCQSLGERLTREAAASNDRIPSRLCEHILMAIPGRRTEVKNAITKIWIATAAACVALAVLIGAFLIIVQRNGRDNVQHDRTQMDVAIHELRSVYKKVGQDLTIIWPQVIEKPLAGEYKRLADDTQSTVRFLVACVNVDIAGAKGRVLN